MGCVCLFHEPFISIDWVVYVYFMNHSFPLIGSQLKQNCSHYKE